MAQGILIADGLELLGLGVQPAGLFGDRLVNGRLGIIERHGYGVGFQRLDEEVGPVRSLDVTLEVADDVAAVGLEAHAVDVRHERRLQKVQERHETLVDARVGRGRKQDEGIAGLCRPLGKPVPVGDVLGERVVGEVVDFVADDHAETEVLHFAEGPIAALQIIERGDDPRLGGPGVSPTSMLLRASWTPSRSKTLNSIPNSLAISSCHCSQIPAGQMMRIRSARRRTPNSRRLIPVSTVLPKPTSLALRIRGRGNESIRKAGIC